MSNYQQTLWQFDIIPKAEVYTFVNYQYACQSFGYDINILVYVNMILWLDVSMHKEKYEGIR